MSAKATCAALVVVILTVGLPVAAQEVKPEAPEGAAVTRGAGALAVWLIDESPSMKDDRKTVRQRFDQLYEDLGIKAKAAPPQRRVLSVVCSFGADLHVLHGKPTNDLAALRKALDRIPRARTEQVRTLAAIDAVLKQYEPYAKKYGRGIVLILVTDEVSDDLKPVAGNPDPIEATIVRLKAAKASLLVFGPEAGAFGDASERTYDPTVPKSMTPWGRARRGLDTAFPEMFQYDDLFRPTPRVPSGFGPYPLARLCRETGGVCYLLHQRDPPTYDYKKMFPAYAPELASREEIAARNRANPVRGRLMEIVAAWNVIDARGRVEHTFKNDETLRERVTASIAAVDARLALVNNSIKRLWDLGEVPAKHSPKRWQANRDLMWAQLNKLRFQLTQYRRTLVMLLDGNAISPPGELGWRISRQHRPRLRGDVKTVLAEKKRIEALFRKVIKTHAKTPWAAFAASEVKHIGGYAVLPWSRKALPGIPDGGR